MVHRMHIGAHDPHPAEQVIAAAATHLLDGDPEAAIVTVATSDEVHEPGLLVGAAVNMVAEAWHIIAEWTGTDPVEFGRGLTAATAACRCHLQEVPGEDSG